MHKITIPKRRGAELRVYIKNLVTGNVGSVGIMCSLNYGSHSLGSSTAGKAMKRSASMTQNCKRGG